MAIFFDLAICTAFSREEALAVCDHFADHEGLLPQYGRQPHRCAQGAWWVNLVPAGIGYGVPGDDPAEVKPRSEQLEILQHLFDRLRSAPAYRFAVLEWEALDRLQDLDDEVVSLAGVRVNRNLPGSGGCVLSLECWTALGKPEDFEAFAEGYRWVPDFGSLLREDA